MQYLCFSLAIACFLSLATSSSNPKPMDENSSIQQYLDWLKESNYNKEVLPIGNDGHGTPVDIRCSMYIIDIFKVDDVSMDYKTQMYFRQSWNDSRLAYADRDISKVVINDPSKIWTPDLFFVQEKEGVHHRLISPNTFIRILPNGEVLYSVRVTMTFTCPMDLSKYPHDVQECSFTVESYGFGSNQISLSWVEKSVGYANITTLPFTLTDVKETSKLSTFSFGEYTSLQVMLTFQRKSGFFMIKVYIPFIILVVLSWLSFWIPSKMMAIRLSLLLVILFLMVNLGFAVSDYTPPTPYTKGSDVWIAVCESLVFACFLELIAVVIIGRNEEKLKKRLCKDDPEARRVLDSDIKMNPITSDTSNAASIVARRLLRSDKLSKSIDKLCGILFPVLFVIFNFIYWLVYCTGH